MRNGEHYNDPTAGGAFSRMGRRKGGVMRESDIERMDSLRPHVPRLETISEADEQTAVVAWARSQMWKYPMLDLLFHVPNGGSRNIAEAVHLKRMGVRAGIPDLCLPYPSAGYHSLWIEMKAAKGRPTALQRETMAKLNEYGHLAIVCHGAGEAIEAIKRYLQGEEK